MLILRNCTFDNVRLDIVISNYSTIIDIKLRLDLTTLTKINVAGDLVSTLVVCICLDSTLPELLALASPSIIKMTPRLKV